MMCRRIVIECEWDDEHPDDASWLFDKNSNYDDLTDSMRLVLTSEVEGVFPGRVNVRVERMHEVR